MKKVLLFGAVALFTSLSAQTEKGSWIIGGSTNLGFNSLSSKVEFQGKSQDGPKVSSFSFSPSVGYFVADKIAVGLDATFASVSQEFKFEGGTDKSTTSTFAIMPTATYYFKSDSKLLPYLGAGIGFSSVKEDDGNEASTTSGLAWKGKGGLVYLLNQTVGLDLGLTYLGTSGKNDDFKDVKFMTSTIGVSAGITIFIK
jgi:outer membrane protein